MVMAHLRILSRLVQKPLLVVPLARLLALLYSLAYAVEQTLHLS
jgi:hypothetical protein